MSQASQLETYDVLCPHCRKRFTSELLGGPGNRQRGFKCPHCKLFVPLERANGNGVAGDGN